MSTNPYQAPSSAILPPDSSAFHDASKGKRFVNMLVDSLFYMVIAMVIGFILGASGKISAEDLEGSGSNALLVNVASMLIMVAYYFLMEQSLGASVGKLVTGTRVVSHDGRKPTAGQILGRSFARLIPFEPLSFLGGGPGGWHDTLSKTRVVLKR
jgi:uncharacterized RDD family membrane protein YckC